MERQSRRRRRPALSCLECRRRKIKCNRNDPCAHCVSARSKCTYRIYDNEPVIQQRSDRGASQGSKAGLSIHVASSLGQADHTRADELITEYGNNLSGSGVAEVPGRLDDTPNTLGRDDIQPSNLALDAELDFATILACFTEASGSSEGTSFEGAETRALIDQIGDLLRKCKNISRSSKVGRPSRHLSSPQFGFAPLSRDMADEMASLYLQSFELVYRIPHIPTFWAEYRKYWDHPEGVTTKLRLKVLLVIGIGSSLSEQGSKDEGFPRMVRQWVYAAQTWLSGPLEKDRLDIAGLQIHCLANLARQIFSIGGDLVWMSTGSIVHRAMQIGLHRDPKHFPAMSVLEAELRRRLWATILEMVVQSSLDSAMPPRISFYEFDTEAPSNINDEGVGESTAALRPRPKGAYTATSIQLLLLDSLLTRLRMLHLLSGLRCEFSYRDVLKLSSEITDACRACSSFVKENEGSGVRPFHRNLLDYLVRRFMIPLHYTFASRARTNPLFYYSLKVSLDVPLALLSPEPDEGFSRLMAGGGWFREGIRYASSVISLELIAQAEAQRLDGTLNRNSQYRDLLKQTLRDMLSLSAERIRRSETNVKAHMFISMVMAQTEAIEADTPCELKVA
ncbi:hypothetical protein DL766_000796 [Monosporascus sp. MC13-8B]|uniref:Zn(2)-C6 fungal-type domain-containing protein n=1 Tax=Monosporascus cannonballus TaxID=155416 RepID=A0ABY0HHB8_9PEZI|nr:hypothetical protein DL762_001105 [Monosporascus cannonballus]RYO98382.1 hypothetical protein DL763_002221 [Monosporascus cannonballus]RYP38796.1 hypothetical protein DL766_000796 [Monosporascus sp. MC13-8B]